MTNAVAESGRDQPHASLPSMLSVRSFQAGDSVNTSGSTGDVELGPTQQPSTTNGHLHRKREKRMGPIYRQDAGWDLLWCDDVHLHMFIQEAARSSQAVNLFVVSRFSRGTQTYSVCRFVSSAISPSGSLTSWFCSRSLERKWAKDDSKINGHLSDPAATYVAHDTT